MRFLSFQPPPSRSHVCSGMLFGSAAALLVPLAGQSVCGEGFEHFDQEGSGGSTGCITNIGTVVFFRQENQKVFPSCSYVCVNSVTFVQIWANVRSSFNESHTYKKGCFQSKVVHKSQGEVRQNTREL